ncbi:MAG: hypothetical protein ACI9U2_005209, partial [Bradymonadia bacterium]
MALFDPMEMAALRVLAGHLGWVRALWYGLNVRSRVRGGEPFAHLPEPLTEKETLSRGQAGPAIVLYRRLRRAIGPEDAVDITTDAVEASALVFLGQSIGPLDRDALTAMSPAERMAFMREKGNRFPNATIRWEQVEAERVRFTVLDCRFVSLCAEAGHPELAPIFCKGDAQFFGGVEAGVTLIREETLAAGGRHCPFDLQWASAGADPEAIDPDPEAIVPDPEAIDPDPE